MLQIRRTGQADVPAVAALSLELWPSDPLAERAAQFDAALAGGRGCLLVAEVDGEAVGFAECAIRTDYVEGTDGGPVGYLEGIYVREAHRRAGVARALLAQWEAWARERGCRALASSCELENTRSLAFHLGAGFREAGRIICFVKEMD